jgi:hypothetical protein
MTMETQRIEVERSRALELYRAYKKHQFYSEPIDAEIQRAYQLISQGRMVIKALESIRAAGLNAQGFPKLAIGNATYGNVRCDLEKDGSALIVRNMRRSVSDKWNTFRFKAGTFVRSPPMKEWREQAVAMVPLVPVHLRPKRGLQNYHVLWEADWTRQPPVDPMLLRRIGGDMWLVVAAWDLTEVERAAMAARISA